MLFSDIRIKLVDQEIPAHKFVLSARSDFFSDAVLVEKTVLGNTTFVFAFVYPCCVAFDITKYAIIIFRLE